MSYAEKEEEGRQEAESKFSEESEMRKVSVSGR